MCTVHETNSVFLSSVRSHVVHFSQKRFRLKLRRTMKTIRENRTTEKKPYCGTHSKFYEGACQDCLDFFKTVPPKQRQPILPRVFTRVFISSKLKLQRLKRRIKTQKILFKKEKALEFKNLTDQCQQNPFSLLEEVELKGSPCNYIFKKIKNIKKKFKIPKIKITKPKKEKVSYFDYWKKIFEKRLEKKFAEAEPKDLPLEVGYQFQSIPEDECLEADFELLDIIAKSEVLSQQEKFQLVTVIENCPEPSFFFLDEHPSEYMKTLQQKFKALYMNAMTQKDLVCEDVMTAKNNMLAEFKSCADYYQLVFENHLDYYFKKCIDKIEKVQLGNSAIVKFNNNTASISTVSVIKKSNRVSKAQDTINEIQHQLDTALNAVEKLNIKELATDKFEFVEELIKDKLREPKRKFDLYLDKAKNKIKEMKVDSLGSAVLNKALIFSDYLASLPIPSIDEFYTALDQIKPINIANLVGQFTATQEATEKFAIMQAIFELYGLFWTPALNVIKESLIYLAVWIVSGLLEMFWSSEGRTKDTWKNQGKITVKEESYLSDICNFLGFNCPNEFDDFGMKIFGAIVAIIAIVTGGSLTKFSDLTLNKIKKRVKEFASSIKSVNILIEGLPKVWGFALSEAASLFGLEYESESSECVRNFKEDLLEFRINVNDLLNTMKNNPQALLMDNMRLQSCLDSMRHLDSLYDKLLKQKENMASTKGIFDDVKKKVDTLEKFVLTLKAQSCQKQEPFVLMIGGKPGIGKSQYIDWFTKKFVEKMHAEYPETQHLNASTYCRTSTEKHWSGYTGQLFVVYDDFGQIKADTDHADLMLVKNPNKTILTMADIEEKGRLFASIGLICATNQDCLTSSAVVKCTGALARRYEVNLVVSDPNFEAFKNAHNGLSPGNYEKEGKGIAMVEDIHKNQIPYFDPNFEHLDFVRVTADISERDKYPPETLDPYQVVDICFNYYKRYKEIYDNSITTPVTAAAFNEADSVSSENRVRGDAKKIIEDFKDLTVNSRAIERQNKNEIENKIRSFVNGQEQETKKEEKEKKKSFKQKKKSFQRSYRQTEYDQYLEGIEEGGFLPPMEYFKTQSQEEVDSSANAFTTFSMDKGDVYALFGPPGTGKSVTIAGVLNCCSNIQYCHGADFHNFVCSSPVVYFEDITVTPEAFSWAHAQMVACTDGRSPIKKMLLTYNPEIAEKFFVCQEQKVVFERRIQPIVFNWSVKQKNFFRKNIYYGIKDIEEGKPHAACVNIEIVKESTPEKRALYQQSQVIEYLTLKFEQVDMSAFKRIITRSVPYIGKNQYTPSFIVEAKDMNTYDFCRLMYNDTAQLVLAITTKKVKMVKGTLTDGIKIASQFTDGQRDTRPDFPTTLDDFILLVNNSEFKSKKNFVVELNCADHSIVIMPKASDPEIIRCFKVCDHLEVSRTIVTDGNASAATTSTNYEIYADYVKTAKVVAESLEESIEEADDRANNTNGFQLLTTKFPKFNSICSILVFGLKLVLAGYSIMTLLNMSKHKFLAEKGKGMFFEKKKGKNKNSIKTALKKNFKSKYNSFQYDALRRALDDHGSAAAKCRKVYEVTQVLEDFYGMNLDELSTDEVMDFIQNAEETDFDFESRPETTPQTPKIATIPTLLMETKKQKTESRPETVPKTPKLEPIPGLLLEKQKYQKKQDSIFINEALVDPNCMSIARLVSANTVELGYCNSDGFHRQVYGLMCFGTFGATVSHFIEQDRQLYMKDLQKSNDILPCKIVKVRDDHDLCFFRVNSKTLLYKDITNHFPKHYTDLSSDYGSKAAILVTTMKTPGIVDRLIRSVKLKQITKIKTEESDDPKVVYTYQGFIAGMDYEGPVHTTNGDCGSAVVVNDKTVNYKIIGFHNAANETKGACTMLFQEYFNSYLERLKHECLASPKKIAVAPKLHKIPYVKMTESAIMGMPICATLNEATYMPTESKFWISPLNRNPANPFQPSVLSPRDPRNKTEKHPYYNAIEKWNHPQPEMDLEKIKEISEDIGHYYADKIASKFIQTKILTKTEAVNSNVSFELNGLNRSSSPGYPWKKYAQHTSDFLTIVEANNEVRYKINVDSKIGQMLSFSIDDIIQISKDESTYPQIAFAGNLKDEPVKLKKIFDVNTRSFAGAPLDYTIASRMYFGTIQSAIHKVRAEMPIQIGIDATGLEWDTMVKHLLSVSDLGFDLDFKGWDSVVPAEVLEATANVYNIIARKTNPDWHPDHDTIRSNMARSLKKPNLVVPLEGNTYIVQAPGGMVSGSPRTADDNSLAHLILIRYIYDIIVTEAGYPQLANMDSFVTYVCCKIYGDDGDYAISPVLLPILNFDTFEKEFKKLGMTCTPAAKGDTIVSYRPVVELEFLKRNTVKIGPHYYGALQKTTFDKMLGYCEGPSHHFYKETRPTPIKEKDLVQTANAALFEAIYHGSPFYEELRDHLLQCFSRVGIEERLPRFKDLIVQRQLTIPRDYGS